MSTFIHLVLLLLSSMSTFFFSNMHTVEWSYCSLPWMRDKNTKSNDYSWVQKWKRHQMLMCIVNEEWASRDLKASKLVFFSLYQKPNRYVMRLLNRGSICAWAIVIVDVDIVITVWARTRQQSLSRFLRFWLALHSTLEQPLLIETNNFVHKYMSIESCCNPFEMLKYRHYLINMWYITAIMRHVLWMSYSIWHVCIIKRVQVKVC